MKKPQMVKVTWIDAHDVLTTWEDADHPESKDDYLVETVGWLLPKRKKGHTVVALNLSDEHVSTGIAIPDNMVVKVEKLRKV